MLRVLENDKVPIQNYEDIFIFARPRSIVIGELLHNPEKLFVKREQFALASLL